MQRHRTHQIDELAQRFFRAAIPVTWSYNEQTHDYGKDYLVEPGDDDGEQTGQNFFVQLKGQEEAEFTADNSHAKFTLKTKHAAYYADKVRDLPVFLVLVDVNARRGWFLFLQPVLEADQAWRKQDSVTVYLPASDDLSDPVRLRQAVEDAKKWMRLHHPHSIVEAVAAHRGQMTKADPRFSVAVSVKDDQTKFMLHAKEPVPLTFKFKGDPEEIKQKVTNLIDKGLLVTFKPGEMSAEGSPLFERVVGGCSVQATTDLPGTATIICRDANGVELARLSDVPGRLTGGRKEHWLDAALSNSPLSVRLGPIAQESGGSIQINVSLKRWDGQRLRQLAYFDRLHQFLRAIPKTTTMDVECHQDGNCVFAVSVPLSANDQLVHISEWLDVLWMARQVAERVGVNPAWSLSAFDADAVETVEQLHAVFFGPGWTQAVPSLRITAQCKAESFPFDQATMGVELGHVRFVSDWTYLFFGEKISVGRLSVDYTAITARLVDSETPTSPPLVELIGSPASTMTIRLPPRDDSDGAQAGTE